MKRFLALLLSFTMVLALVSCGASQSDTTAKTAGYLPTRLEDISEGGIVPEGYEAGTSMTTGNYPLESIWGTWVPISAVTSKKTFTANTTTYTDEETGEQSQPKSIELKVFPEELTFCPPWENASPWGLSIGMQYSTYSFDMNQEDTDYEDTVIGAALRNQGLGQGNVEYTYIEPDDPFEALSVSLDGGQYRIAYGISADTLAIGLISTNESEPASFDIQEIDYHISFTAWKLTLSYGEESVTYVPKDFDQSEMIDLYENGVEPGYESIDGILGISYRDPIIQVMYDIHEGYIDAEMDFTEDGTLTIVASNGNQSAFNYLVSSNALTLISGSDIAVYSAYRSGKESVNAAAGTTGVISIFGTGASISVDGQTIGFSAMSDLQKLLDAGFTTSVDTSQAMNPCVVSDEITLKKSGSSINVKVVNPWDSPTALRECKICYVYVDDTTGTISSADDSVIGTTKYDVIERYFEAAYEKTPTLLRYKVYSTADHSLTLIAFGPKDGNHGERLLDIDSTEMELLYHFNNGVLCAYELQCPELLYNGLQDNVSSDALANMDAATMTGVIEIRDSVMDQLKKAFDNAGIQVNINESTGEIDMDTNVLFGYDSTELSAEGQAYIDSFMGVYASVILDDSLKDVISEVRFEGHTDSSGSFDYNLGLSQERADAVLNYCLSSNASSMNRDQKERLNSIASTIGYSYADLVYDENGNEDADASRRVAIKFYIAVDGNTNTNQPAGLDTAQTTGGLTAADFVYTDRGVTCNTLEGEKGVAWYCHFDPEKDNDREGVMETARGIHIGDPLSDLFSAYGNTDIYIFDSENPFYSADDYRSAMLKECSTFVIYWYNDEDAIAFFLDDWNCVSWVVYYIP